MLEIGSLVDGKYKILNKVGQGGMSVVYLAMNERANKQWAVKEIRKDGIKNFEVVKQGLVAEIDILKRLNHPNLPSIIDVIDNEDSFIIVMDYIEGNSLNKILEEYGAQPQDKVIEWAKQLCDVLGYLHTRKPPIIYRDMKPANIMLKPDGNITLIDFGTAREFKEKNLADTTCLGTVGYAAPEQFGGMGQTDARTDIYCLGATLYHLVTGMTPCEPPYAIKPIREINPSFSSGLEKIILKSTQANPDDRYQSAAELMYALSNYEEIDDKYKKKQQRKLGVFVTSALLTVAFSVTAGWGYCSAENKKSENYDYILANASKAEDYFNAIVTDLTRTEAYLGNGDFRGILDFLIDDGELSKEDSAILSKLKGGVDQTNPKGYSTTVDVMKALSESNEEGYEDVCYRIGEAYLFYYDIGVEKDKYQSAAAWFQYSQNKYPVSTIYCEISECIQNIAKYKKADQYSKLYDEYQALWGKVLQLKKDAEEFDSDLRLRVWNEIVNMISDNVSEFCEVASQEEVLTILDSISDSLQDVNTALREDDIAFLKNNIETASTKIHSLKSSKE